VADNVSGGHVDRGGAVVAGERGGGAEPIDGADPAEDLAAVKSPMPHSSVRVVPEAVTAVLMSAAALGDPTVQVAYLGDQGRRRGRAGFCWRHRGTDLAKEFGRPARR